MSRKAKEKAEAAEKRAEEAEQRARDELRQMQEQTDALRRLAESQERRAKLAQGPVLEVERGPKMGSSPRLVNVSQEEVQVEEVVNQDDFLRLDGLDTPFMLAPWQALKFRAFEAMGKPLPATLHLRLGDGRDVHVRL